MNRFEYYRRSRNPEFPLFYDSKLGMLQDFGDRLVSLTSRGGQPWAPVVMNQLCPQMNVTWLTNLHTLWQPYFDDGNFGHTVWEDIGSIYYSLERMNEFDHELMIMQAKQISNDNNIQKFLDSILVVLTKNKLGQYQSYLTEFKTDYICFQRFIAGGNLVIFTPEGVKDHDGREALFYNWRSEIIAYHHLDPDYIPTEHRIVITNKSTSVWAKRPDGLHRAIANLPEVVNFVRQTFPQICVDVIEWHKVSLIKQIELLLKTTVLISPAGGVSMIAPFLPHGSHAILMDYYATENAIGFQAGSSASMEGMLLNHFPHFKKDYYQIYGKDDYVFDFPGATNTRNDASIRVNLERLRLLIESAIHDMSL